MEFCDVCENMLYVRNNGQGIIHKCNCCSKEFDIFKSRTTCISKKTMNKSDMRQLPMINKHMFDDPTIPIVSYIPCTSCKTSPSKVAYIRYDTPNMKYIYHCKNCEATWGLQA